MDKIRISIELFQLYGPDSLKKSIYCYVIHNSKEIREKIGNKFIDPVKKLVEARQYKLR